MTQEEKYNENAEKIAKLLNENIDIAYNQMLSNATRFSEEKKNVGTKKKPFWITVKYMHYMENFQDEDTLDVIPIERHWIIEIDGEKSNGWDKIEYFTIEDIKNITDF